jgi:hypothetical protein
MRIRFLLALLVPATGLTGCATIMHGAHQDVGISSSPTNASVAVDQKPVGHTPVIASLGRGDNHIVRIEFVGYQPYEATLTKKVSGWVWGNIVFGGLIGLAVDAISGGLYNLTPEQINGTLAHQLGSTTITKDGIYVVLVQYADPNWTQIGTLRRQ